MTDRYRLKLVLSRNRLISSEAPNKNGPSDSDSRDLSYRMSAQDPPGGNAASEAKDYISMDVVARHNLAHDCWVVVDGKIFE